jgi:hypothetical protein
VVGVEVTLNAFRFVIYLAAAASWIFQINKTIKVVIQAVIA